ncbi:MAG: acetyl-CoA carboxylase biotin carboxyl carrier protein subunit, partial [Rhizomicrobium sp.]
IRLTSGAIAVMDRGETFVVQPYDPFAAADEAGAATDRIVTPMPGKVIQLLVKAGDAVKRGQPLAVLEAMKMEHTLSAPADETIESVSVSTGDQVAEGTIVIRFAREKTA